MRVLIQRVSSSQVVVDGKVIGSIGQGLNLLVGIGPSDTEDELEWMAQKCLNLRLFPNSSDSSSENRFDQSVTEIGGELLVVSQFTLYGDGRKGRRPSFAKAAPPALAEKLYEKFLLILRQSGLKVEAGRFGANDAGVY